MILIFRTLDFSTPPPSPLVSFATTLGVRTLSSFAVPPIKAMNIVTLDRSKKI